MTVPEALEQLALRLPEIYADELDRIILYGSAARGTDTEESDVDIALILRSEPAKERYEEMLDAVVELELSCGKVLSVIRINADRLNRKSLDSLIQ